MSGWTKRAHACKARASTAWELMRAEVPMHLIADNAAGHLMRTGQVDVVIFGADRVAANGDVANKIGTYKLAVVARENGIPVYAVVPTSTIDLNLPDGDHIPDRGARRREVTHVGDDNDCAGRRAGLQPGLRRDAPPLPDRHHHRRRASVTRPFTMSLRRAKEAAEARIRQIARSVEVRRQGHEERQAAD